jgi:hypothetical protein
MNTTVWLIRYTAGDVPRATVSLHNSVADYRRCYPDATSQAIDCAAAMELVEAVRERVLLSRRGAVNNSTGPFADSDARIDAALARFGSAP